MHLLQTSGVKLEQYDCKILPRHMYDPSLPVELQNNYFLLTCAKLA